jgi:hypothetical protein
MRALIQLKKDVVIHQRLQKTQNVVYGGKSLNIQLPFYLQRKTIDYDIYSKTPKKHAKKLEKKLDFATGANYFYTKPAIHPGTFRVMDKGFDNIKGTKDDINIADYTTPTRKIRSISIMGVRYARLSERRKDIKKSLSNPMFKFRHEKDRQDLWRIKQSNKLRRFFGW